jgi:hypothetical protein
MPSTKEEEDAWIAEIERRAEEMESGAVEGIPWEDLREKLKRSRQWRVAASPSTEVPLSRQCLDTPFARHHQNLRQVGRHAELRSDVAIHRQV